MDQKQFEATLHDAEIRLRRLKTLYDQWLAGTERLEPNVPRNELDDMLARLKREQVRNTALRFRLQQLSQRYTMLLTYWRRIARQIEEGTYQRDVIRARKLRDRAKAERGGEEPDTDFEVGYEVDVADALAEAAQAAEAALEASKPSAEPATAAVADPTLPSQPSQPAQLPVQPAQVSTAPRPAPPQPSVAPRPSAAPRTISPFAMPLPPGQTNSMRAPPPIPAAAMKPPAAGAPSAAPAKPGPGAIAAAQAVARLVMPKPPAAAPGAPAAPANRGQNGPGQGTLSNDDVQRIYTTYVAARKQNAERVDNVKIETIEKSLRGMLPQLEKKHAGKKIDFEVVVKDGKVALKPVAK